MKRYDVIVVGGGIAGAVAARFAAQYGLKTLLVERKKTPREKPCSGIQWGYFEKLLGVRIPPEKLCRNPLFRVEIVDPAGRQIRPPIRIKTLNFWRSTFDHWLDIIAAEAGAEFRDETACLDLAEDDRGVRVRLGTPGQEEQVVTRYLIAADGTFSPIRRRLRPADFQGRSSGGGINYYLAGGGDVDENTLYMVHNVEFAPLMFAWIYKKDDLWVVGTGAEEDPRGYAERFLDYVREKYALRGEIVRREGFAAPNHMPVYLGQGRVLLTGDAAGLLDVYRGMGMDNAALSGRLAARALRVAMESGQPAVEVYERLMSGMLRQMERNARKQAARYASNETLGQTTSISALLGTSLGMLPAMVANRFLPPEKVLTLPL